MSRANNRKAKSKLASLSNEEIEIIAIRYVLSLQNLSLYKRLSFSINLVFKKFKIRSK